MGDYKKMIPFLTNTKWCAREDLQNIVNEKIMPVDVVLDIGCGINPEPIIKPRIHICCDPFIEYIEELRKITTDRSDRLFLIAQADWRKVVEDFPSKSVDTVFLIDVIEHLSKKEGQELLKKTEEIARDQVVIFTPLGMTHQEVVDGKDAWSMNGAVWQEHHSGWYPEDFKNGWEIFACKEYHLTDNLEKKLKKPWGAIWAIKTHFSYKSFLFKTKLKSN